MNVLCLSAANVVKAKENSASVQVCRMVRDELVRQLPQVRVEIVPLVDQQLRSCMMCGDCAETFTCPYDSDFNHLLRTMQQADALFVVCPHYAPFPSKLMILLEKLEELFYIKYCRHEHESWPLSGKPVGIVAHGGGVGMTVDGYYTQNLLNPLATVLQSCGFQPISPDGESKGIVFGVRGYLPQEGSIFPAMDHDWEMIADRLRPLTCEMVRRLRGQDC